jgi:chromosomal replication initiation ATPase DnaA
MTQLPLDLGFRPALGRADFFVAPCNEEAVAWLEKWPHWPSPLLALAGPPRSGKSHLAEVWRARSGAVSIKAGDLQSSGLPELLGPATAAVIDNADAAEEEALLHFYNLLAERRGHLLVIAREPPARWGIRLDDLRSRLLAAPVVAVKPPDEDVIGALLVKLFADRQLIVGEEVLAYLRVQLERSFEAAHETVAALDAASLADSRAITIPFARQVLNRRRDRTPP